MCSCLSTNGFIAVAQTPDSQTFHICCVVNICRLSFGTFVVFPKQSSIKSIILLVTSLCIKAVAIDFDVKALIVVVSVLLCTCVAHRFVKLAAQRGQYDCDCPGAREDMIPGAVMRSTSP